MQKLFKFFLVILIFSVGSCGLFDNFDENPMFISLKDPSLSTFSNEGSNSHNIKDIWVSADGRTIGVFELPDTIPVYDQNQITSMQYFAGIRRNGTNSDHWQYPFYDRIEITYDYEPEVIRSDDLEFSYREDVVFSLIENFTGVHTFTVDVDEDTSTIMEQVNDGCLEGACGLIRLETDTSSIEVASGIGLQGLPTNGTPVYLEIDYKNDIEFSIGLQGELGSLDLEQYLILLKPSEEWNKLYLDFTDLLQQSGLETYRVLFGANSGPGNIYIDNVKLIHF